MRVFLDTFDLINLLEKGEPSTLGTLEDLLRLTGGTLVVCPEHLTELAAPLASSQHGSTALVTLNKLESLPISFANEVKIPLLELTEALDAFRAGRETHPIDPYVDRLDAAVPLVGSSPTEHFLNYPLAEMAFDLWQDSPEVLRSHPEHVMRLRSSIERWRSTTKGAGDCAGFVASVRDLAMNHVRFGLRLEDVNLKKLGQWLWDEPRRSPGISLWFKVRHQLVLNTRDRVKDSDIADLSWMWLLPYVDLATLDRRMKSYVERVLGAGKSEHRPEIHGSFEAVLRSLKKRACSGESPRISPERVVEKRHRTS